MTNRVWARHGVAVGVSLALSACATVTVEDEVQAGSGLDQQVRQQIGTVTDSPVSPFVEELGLRLAGYAEPNPYRFRFAVIDQAEPNAFAAPGGYVYVSRGLLTLVESEDELAGVLGHEISHVTRRHHVRQAQRSILPGILSVPGRVVGVVNEDVGRVMTSPLDAYVAGYSRSQETEADTVGMGVAARAGYEPGALALILDRIEDTATMLSGQQRQASWTDTHPTTPDRVANIEQRGAQLEVAQVPPLMANRDKFLDLLDGLWIGENPEAGVFEGQRFIQPALGIEITFPDGWQTFNSASMVGAVTQSEDAVIVVGASRRVEDPAIMAEALAAKVRQAAGLEPVESRAVEIGDWPGYLLQFVEGSGEDAVGVYYLFVDSGKIMYQLVAGAADSYRPALRETALSLKPAKAPDIAKIEGLRLRIVQARSGETLSKAATRQGNALNDAALALINGMSVDTVLTAGSRFKIARNEPCCQAP